VLSFNLLNRNSLIEKRKTQRVFEIRVLVRIFGSKREEVVGG
jgi:hypothetical protein